MDDIRNLSRKRLKKLIVDTQQTLNELTYELERRKHEVQNEEIDNLDQHMDLAEVNLSKIKDFILLLLKENKT